MYLALETLFSSRVTDSFFNACVTSTAVIIHPTAIGNIKFVSLLFICLFVCSCGFAGDDTESLACSSTYCSRLKARRPYVTPALLELDWFPITERIQYKLCLPVHKVFVGHAPDYIASLLTPASDIPSRSSLRRRVTVTWSYQERVGRLVTGLSLLPHPVLGIG